jgi:hypothetical protein
MDKNICDILENLFLNKQFPFSWYKCCFSSCISGLHRPCKTKPEKSSSFFVPWHCPFIWNIMKKT